MLIGRALCSPIISFYALFGSIVSILTAMGMGVNQSNLYAGLWGFSGSLSSIALGGNFFVLKGF